MTDRPTPLAADGLATLEARLRRLEDERDIARLMTSYGPLVDSGCAAEVAGLWEPDGVYDIDELYLSGRDEIDAMVRSAAHQGWIRAGCAHVVGPPHITVDGDTAVAVCHSLMVVHDEGRYVVRRATANHWRLRRSDTGWLVTTRTNRILDGRPESPALLQGGVRGEPADD
ncbi:nuclear transport factor 2 family protein [Streptomyces sp. B-S-A8]|uniref:Nuclear transport factor 2 family protein n=1 Tax=Streptomyces solicavernae TaxID=3043614 RepID=A0ABT6RVK7_9ACTN|nr:nuclear transport factor 2 family protein [Streptomyces sp. B-S-A8]MDI3388491.1 nuclear transport factor 2 family protein [Streptomyces sp. B-S-A8]